MHIKLKILLLTLISVGLLTSGWALLGCASAPKQDTSSGEWDEFDEADPADADIGEEAPVGTAESESKLESESESESEADPLQEAGQEGDFAQGDLEDPDTQDDMLAEETLAPWEKGESLENEPPLESAQGEEGDMSSPLQEEDQGAFPEEEFQEAQSQNNPEQQQLQEQPQLQEQQQPQDDFQLAEGSESATSAPLVRVNDIEFVAEREGGTVMIETSGNPSYNTRFNEKTHQFILEIFNSELPTRLGRPFNTKDFQSHITFVKAYQTQNGNTNVVIQLRDGSPKPSVKMESNVLLVSTGFADSTGSLSASSASSSESSSESHFTKEDSAHGAGISGGRQTNHSGKKILSAYSLQQFLMSNNRFYGRKISIITKEMQLKDFFNFIAEESGINLVLSKQIMGEVSLKLRNVPWDQALVVVMKANNLGYTRHGNVLRIASLNVLRAEEEEAQKLLISRRKVEPIHVYTVPVSYADVDKLKDKLKPFLSNRGHIAGDSLTSSLIVTDTKDHIENIEKLVSSLDIPPPQVFIEGKIVEASSTFSRELGVNWGMAGGSFELSKSATQAVRLNPELNISPGGGASAGKSFFAGINVGTFKNLGNINAFLSLNERTEQIKVISSPRITAMNNSSASISQKTEIPITTSVNDGGVVTQNITFKPINLKLNVTPQVTGDDSVLLKIDVTREFLGSLISTKDAARPVNSRSVKTRVLVKNGETAVIGGILQSDVTKGETGVPFLRKIPFLGALFRSRSETKDRTELLIFLTPKVIYNPHTRASKGSNLSHPHGGNNQGNQDGGDFNEDFPEENDGFGENEDPIMYEQSQ